MISSSTFSQSFDPDNPESKEQEQQEPMSREMQGQLKGLGSMINEKIVQIAVTPDNYLYCLTDGGSLYVTTRQWKDDTNEIVYEWLKIPLTNELNK